MLASADGTHMQFLDADYVPTGLLDTIAAEPRFVLDVGCYCGATGAEIKRRWPNATVVGIEPLAGAASRAASRLDQVINSTLDAVRFEELGITPGTFDTIIFADVLEHMYNPWAALQQARQLLSDDGVVLASIPNVRNLGLIRKLVEGRWTYEGLGLLDITHIRFFTLAEIRELFAQTGFRVAAVRYGVDPEFVQLWNFEPENDSATVQLGSLVINQVSAADRKELASRHFFVRAQKAGSAE